MLTDLELMRIRVGVLFTQDPQGRLLFVNEPGNPVVALDVVSEWAQRVRALGAIPLYSTSWENEASRGVARKLSLEYYGADFQIT